MEQTLFMNTLLNHLLFYSRELASAHKPMLMPQEELQPMQSKIFENY